MGFESGFNTVSGNANVGIGFRSCYSNTVGRNNICIGEETGRFNTFGHNNVFIGHAVGYNNTVGNANVLIGYQAGYDETGSDKLYIANSNTANPLIYGDFDNNNLSFAGFGTRFGGSQKVVAIPINVTAPVGNVAGGAVIYFDGTTLKYKYGATVRSISFT